MKSPHEKDVQRAILDYLKLANCFPIRINSGAMFGEHKGKKWAVRMNSEEGCSDILCCVPVTVHAGSEGVFPARQLECGEFLALEVKADAAGVATPKQKSFGEKVARAGGTWACVHSVQQVRDILRDMGADRVPDPGRTASLPPSLKAGRRVKRLA